VFDEDTPNEEIYRCTTQPLIESVFRGSKVTCFAYGQTVSFIYQYLYYTLPFNLGVGKDVHNDGEGSRWSVWTIRSRYFLFFTYPSI
jgi:hypothetical protein